MDCFENAGRLTAKQAATTMTIMLTTTPAPPSPQNLTTKGTARTLHRGLLLRYWISVSGGLTIWPLILQESYMLNKATNNKPSTSAWCSPSLVPIVTGSLRVFKPPLYWQLIGLRSQRKRFSLFFSAGGGLPVAVPVRTVSTQSVASNMRS